MIRYCLFILFGLTGSCCSQDYSEVVSRINDFLEWDKITPGYHVELREKDIQAFEGLSGEEIIGGFILKMEIYDDDPATRMRARVGGQVATLLKFNHQIIADNTFLRKEMAMEREPRRFYHLGRLGYSLTQGTKEDFIPEMFNSLFRDGRVCREEGEYTAPYAHDVSVFAHSRQLLSCSQRSARDSRLLCGSIRMCLRSGLWLKKSLRSFSPSTWSLMIENTFSTLTSSCFLIKGFHRIMATTVRT